MELRCLSNTGPFWSILGVVPKVWYKEVQLTWVYSQRHHWTLIGVDISVANSHSCECASKAKSWQWLRLGSWTNMEVWSVICVPTQGETLTQIYREFVLSLCTGNKFLCGAKHSKMAEMTWWTKAVRPSTPILTFRHRASCILGQAFRYSPENAFYIFNQQIYFIIWYLLDRASLI